MLVLLYSLVLDSITCAYQMGLYTQFRRVAVIPIQHLTVLVMFDLISYICNDCLTTGCLL